MSILKVVALILCVAVATAILAMPLHPCPTAAPAAASTGGLAAALPGAGGPMGHLMGLRPGRSARVSSAAPTRGSNADNRRIAPGGKCVLADIAGPGTIQHIWLTFPEPAPG